jgi:hypothetical protein
MAMPMANKNSINKSLSCFFYQTYYTAFIPVFKGFFVQKWTIFLPVIGQKRKQAAISAARFLLRRKRNKRGRKGFIFPKGRRYPPQPYE